MVNNTSKFVTPQVPKEWKILFGGIAGMAATSLVHPFDLLKVRLQMFKDSTSISLFKEIVANDGIKGLYAGVGAGLFRQATYTTTRLGVYNWMYESYKEKYKMNPPLSDTILIGVYAGIAGAFAGTPAEVILVRMMADRSHYPCYCEKKYKSVLHAISLIRKNEGVTALWRGGFPTVIRSVFVSTAQLGTYSKSHEKMLEYNFKNNLLLHVYCSLLAGFATAVASLPSDNIKTKSQFIGENRNQLTILTSVIRKEGVLALWRGFLPYYWRLSIHTVLTFVFMEKLNMMYIQYYK